LIDGNSPVVYIVFTRKSINTMSSNQF